MITVQERLKEKKLLFDGAFGTYYAQVYNTKSLPELANTEAPERVIKIHKEYIEAGAQLIRTNTFASNVAALDMPWEVVKENIHQGYRLACEAVKEMQAVGGYEEMYVAADIGQIAYDNQMTGEAASKEYVDICRTFLEEGAEIFVFETFSDMEDIRAAIEYIGDKAFVIVQFSVNQFGYSNSGLSARKLIERAENMTGVDAVGFNCGVGPGHMQQIIRNINYSGKKWFTALPNAGYPQIVSNRMIFDNKNMDYFVDKAGDIAADGVDIVGGCCGTTPEYIRRRKERRSFVQNKKQAMKAESEKDSIKKQDFSFYAGKEGKKLIAV